MKLEGHRELISSLTAATVIWADAASKIAQALEGAAAGMLRLAHSLGAEPGDCLQEPEGKCK